jgi:transglutaminase-like putative cysteine protease
MRGLPAPEVAFQAPTWSYAMELEATEGRQLVALDLPRAAPDGARLSIDHGLYVRRPLVSTTRWRMEAAPVAEYESALRITLRQRALELPDGFNPRTVALGREWREAAGTDDAAIVARALDWIRRDFGYTLGVDPPGRHSVDEFLFDTRLGYCEHFSSAFTVLMRAAGIPARVVTGYAGGYYNRFGDYWLVRRADAHAWSEVWLPGRGWVRIDPTAAVAPERVFDTIADRQPGGLLGALGGGGAPALDFADWMRRGWNDFVLGFDATRQRNLLRPLGIGASTTQIAVLFALVAALALAVMGWLVAREQREADPVLRAWHRLGRRYARLGLARGPHEPAFDWLRRVEASHVDPVSELNALTRRFVEWRYARGAGDAHAVRDLVRDLRAHRP